MTRNIVVAGAVSEGTGTFQSKEAKDVRELIEITAEEVRATIGEMSIDNGLITFTVENEEQAKLIVPALEAVGLAASVKDRKEMLLERVAQRKKNAAPEAAGKR